MNWVVGTEPWKPVMQDLMPSRVRFVCSDQWLQPPETPLLGLCRTRNVAFTCHDLDRMGDSGGGGAQRVRALATTRSRSGLARMDDDIILHVAMTEKFYDFQQYVLPILAAGPARAHERSLPSTLSRYAFDAQSTAEDYTPPVPQVVLAQWLDLAAGATAVVTFAVPAGDTLAATLVAPDQTTAALLDPQGATIGAFPTGLFRTVWANEVSAGIWTINLHNPDTTAVSVTVSAIVDGAAEELEVTVDAPTWDRMTQISARLGQTGLHAGSTQASQVLTMTARINRATAEGVLYTLWDDGAHGDGAAGDGVFGARIGPLAVDVYDLSVYAVGRAILPRHRSQLRCAVCPHHQASCA
jgi:hypothetical protein